MDYTAYQWLIQFLQLHRWQKIESRWKFGRQTCFALVDIEKAYDNINRHEIYKNVLLHKANNSKRQRTKHL